MKIARIKRPKLGVLFLIVTLPLMFAFQNCSVLPGEGLNDGIAVSASASVADASMKILSVEFENTNQIFEVDASQIDFAPGISTDFETSVEATWKTSPHHKFVFKIRSTIAFSVLLEKYSLGVARFNQKIEAIRDAILQDGYNIRFSIAPLNGYYIYKMGASRNGEFIKNLTISMQLNPLGDSYFEVTAYDELGTFFAAPQLRLLWARYLGNELVFNSLDSSAQAQPSNK